MKKITALLIIISLLIPCGAYAAGETATVNPSYVSLYVGEACSLSVDTTLTNLKWRNGNPDSVELFGDYYKSKTVYGIKPGSSVIWISDEAGDDLVSVVVQVSEKPALSTTTADFSRGISVPINRNVFGEHLVTYTTYTDSAKLVEENIRFGSARIGFNPGDDITDYTSYAESYLTPVMRNDMTIVLILSRIVKDDEDSLMEQVKAICSVLGNYQDDIYIEFGNETMNQLSSTFTLDDYIAKCKSLYSKIKEYASTIGKDIYTAVPIADISGKESTWNKAMVADQTYYDAVVPHLYTYISTYDGYTQNVKMKRLFSSNENMYKTVDYAKESFSSKDIWITEYGTLDNAMMSAPTSAERARLQSSKTLGVALCNIDKTLNFLTDSSVKIANYHVPNDSQLFGIVQGTDVLPNFYVFKELSDILSESTHISQLTPASVPTFNFEGTNYSENQTVNSVGAYSLSDSNGLKYAVFINRSENPCNVTYGGKLLKPVWKYSTEYVLGEDYLRKTGTFLDMPLNVPEPQVLSGMSEAASVTIDGYSMTICEITGETLETLTITSELDGKVGVPPEAEVAFELSDDAVLTSDDLTVTADGQSVSATVSGSGSQYVAEFDKIPNTEYTLSINETSSVTFTTAYDTNVAKIDFGTFSGSWKSAAFGKDLSEITLKITFKAVAEYKGVWLVNDNSYVSKVTIDKLTDTTMKLNGYWYDSAGEHFIGATISGVEVDDTVYITYKNKSIYPCKVSSDGTVTYGTSASYANYMTSENTFDEMRATSAVTCVSVGGTEVPEISVLSADKYGNVTVGLQENLPESEGILICAAYEESNLIQKLIKADKYKVTSTESEYDFSLGLSSSDNLLYKIFYWNDTDNIQPITQACLYNPN